MLFLEKLSLVGRAYSHTGCLSPTQLLHIHIHTLSCVWLSSLPFSSLLFPSLSFLSLLFPSLHFQGRSYFWVVLAPAMVACTLPGLWHLPGWTQDKSALEGADLQCVRCGSVSSVACCVSPAGGALQYESWCLSGYRAQSAEENVCVAEGGWAQVPVS